MSKNGILVYLIPSDIIHSDGSTILRKYIFNNYNMNFFYQFENRKIFKDIDNRNKFAIFSINNNVRNNYYIKTKFMQHSFNSLNHENTISYSYELINAISPDHNLLFKFKDNSDIPITKKMYSQFNKINPNFIDFRNELHMTSDNHLFKEEYKNGYIELYEGKMIHQFNNIYEKPVYYVDLEELKKDQQQKELNRMISSIYEQIPNAKGNKLEIVLKNTIYSTKEELISIINYDNDYNRLAFRGIASDTNERSIISALLPKNSVSGNSIYVSHAKIYKLENKQIKQIGLPIHRLLFMNAILNSLAIDYLIRFIIDKNISKTYLMQLPIPQPSNKELEENKVYEKLYLNALKLTLAYNFESFKDLAEQFNIKEQDLPRTAKERDLLKIQNDIEIAKIYGLTYKELAHIISDNYFKTMNKEQSGYVNLLKTKAQEEL